MKLSIPTMLVTALAMGVTVIAQAQDSSPSASVPVIKANARDVVVDVVVTKDGKSAVGLKKGDFEIEEDGKPQALDFFEEHQAKTMPPDGIPAPVKMPPNVYTNVPPAPADEAVNVLLLDSLNTPPQMGAYARNEVLSYLNHVKPGTRIAILLLNGKLSIAQGFTTDVARLREITVRQTAPAISPSLVTKSEVADEQFLEGFIASNSMRGGGSSGNSASGPGWDNPTTPMDGVYAVAAAFENYKALKQMNKARMTLEALSDIARYLAAVPGRKNLIWFSGDFPIEVFPKFDQRAHYADNAILLSEVQKAADRLTAARVAVYPIFANGMMDDDIVSAANLSPASGAPFTGNPVSMPLYTESNNDRAAEIAAMNQLAHDTGGKAVYNTNDLDSAISRSIADGSSYYTLTYSPTNKKMDGHYRKIEVKLADSKLKLSYRHGYNASAVSALAPGTKEAADALRQQLVFGMPDATEILFAARVAPAAQQPAPGDKIAGRNPKLTGPVTRYAIDIMIRWTDLALGESANGIHQGKIGIGLIAWDAQGKSVNWEEGTQEMALKPEIFAAIQKSGIPTHMEVDLPNSDLFLRIGVLDVATGKVGTLEFPFHPTEASAAAQTSSAR